MNNNIKFIHVGFPKCGSTFLQSEVFDKIKDINAITVGGRNRAIPKLLPYITNCLDPYYSQKHASEEAKKISPDINGISNEGFTGFSSPEIIAGRVKKTFGEVKILIVIRNQKAILLSRYLHDIKIGYVSSFEKWLELLFNSFRFNSFKYSYAVESYTKQFGNKNVKVVLFEELFNKNTITEIIDFLGFKHDGIEEVQYDKKVNAAYSPLSLALNRKLNSHFGTQANHGAGYIYELYRYRLASKVDKLYALFGGSKKPEYFNEKILDLINEWYHEDNLVLGKILNKNLSEKGYL